MKFLLKVLVFIGLKLYEIFKYPMIGLGGIIVLSMCLGIIGIPGSYIVEGTLIFIEDAPFFTDFTFAWTFLCFGCLIGYGVFSIIVIVAWLAVLFISIFLLGAIFYRIPRIAYKKIGEKK